MHASTAPERGRGPILGGNMGTYIPVDSDPQIPPPYRFPGVTMQSFLLQANQHNLQALCDRQLNIGSLAERGFEYRAILPYVFLEFVVYPRMLFDMLPYSTWGFTTQNELYFKFFVAKYILIDGLFLLPMPWLTAFFPYIFVDNPWSVIAGRDVLGFPKLIAKFVAAGKPYPISAETFAIDQFATNGELKSRQFIKIDAADGIASLPVHNSWGLSQDDLAALDPTLRTALTPKPPIAAGRSPATQILRTVHLKQLRDPDTPTDACYQAIVEGAFEVENFQPVASPPAKIQLQQFATLSIGPTLGLSPVMPLHPLSQFTAPCDLRYTGATTVFENNQSGPISFW
jgi:hypothetical protein